MPIVRASCPAEAFELDAHENAFPDRRRLLLVLICCGRVSITLIGMKIKVSLQNMQRKEGFVKYSAELLGHLGTKNDKI